jgi:hypothetical protein
MSFDRQHPDPDYRRRANQARDRISRSEQAFRGRCKELGIDDSNVDKALAAIVEHDARLAPSGLPVPTKPWR